MMDCIEEAGRRLDLAMNGDFDWLTEEIRQNYRTDATIFALIAIAKELERANDIAREKGA